MHKFKRFVIYCLLFSVSIVLVGQKTPEIQTLSGSYTYSWNIKDRPITAIAIAGDQPLIASLISAGGIFPLERDVDYEGFHYFLSLPLETVEDSFLIRVSDSLASVYLINSGTAPELKIDSKARKNNICEDAPVSVSQSVWREGLSAPNYSRSFHEVTHIIVHHSAGSNQATNYTQVVRDIYLYHTEINGWSDIGYNYLIAQDGTLYAGRDPGDGNQSNVRGAHFCGANTNTMGVCLLGNYETAQPTESSKKTLIDLLTFESLTLELDPLDETEHRTGILGAIAGHRDGCATLCPGENTYSQLGAIRTTVLNQKINCQGGRTLDFTFNHEILGINQKLELTNQSIGYQRYQWYIDGLLLPEDKGLYSFGIPGNYDLGVLGYINEAVDSLILRNAVKVSWLEKEPIIFPNPTVTRTITIDYRPEIIKVLLSDLQGKKTYQLETDQSTITLPKNLESGIYILSLTTTENLTLSEKIVIR